MAALSLSGQRMATVLVLPASPIGAAADTEQIAFPAPSFLTVLEIKPKALFEIGSELHPWASTYLLQ